MSMPLTLGELQLRNFMSFGNVMTTIDLSQLGSVLIIGENMDTNDPNGAGKTTLINAVCYAFYNKPFQNISLNRLINSTNSSKNTLMEVRLTFIKGDDTYSIYRCRGESFNIVLSKNGDDMTFASVGENDAALVEILGMSYELFTKVIIFSGKSIPFLELPVAHQRNQIEELFSITLLSEKAVKLKKIIKDTEEEILVQSALIKERESQIESYQKHLRDAQLRVSRWEEDRVKQVEKLVEAQEIFNSIDINDEKEKHSQIKKLEDEYSVIKTAYMALTNESASYLREIKKLTGELDHLNDAKCPYCLQDFKGSKKKMLVKQVDLADLEVKYDKANAEYHEIYEAGQHVMEEISSIKKKLVYKTMSDAVRAESSSSSNQEKINGLITAENPHTDAYKDLQVNPVKSASTDQLDDLKKDLEHQLFLLKLLTDKNSFIRRKIINRTIPFLNSRLIHYTKELGLPHIVKFDDDMSCTVAEMGRELDFGGLSGGEAKRVNLSFSLAFRDVLHQLHSKVNCLFIDEIDGSLAGPGVELAFKLLKQKIRDDNLGLWIISHRPEAIGRFDRSIVVRKQNGFSSILENE